MTWDKIKNIYMIGIKGVGMTMLAQYLAGQDFNLSGSDIAESFMTDAVLAKAGIKVKSGFNPANIPADADLIIYSQAYDESNPELAAVMATDKKVMSYGQALAHVFNQSFGIAVAGSHGKTTTSAWLGFVLNQAGLSPSVLVGARVPQFDGSALIGKSNYLVSEVDEYKNKFASLNPKITLLNNIDYDHHDFFPTADSYYQAFVDFANNLSVKDLLIANFDDDQVQALSQTVKARVTSYAINHEADFVARDIKTQNGRQYFSVTMNDEDLGEFSTQLLGHHNIYNALAVIAASLELGADLHLVRGALSEFTGTCRRLEKLGTYHGATIFDDYAHHPTEIKATIKALRQVYPDKQLTVVFHPHTFSRTKALFNDFANSFAGVDKLIVLDIYGSARETSGGTSSAELVEKMRLLDDNKIIIHIPTLDEVVEHLKLNAKHDEIIVLMGAGDVFRIGGKLLPTNN